MQEQKRVNLTVSIKRPIDVSVAPRDDRRSGQRTLRVMFNFPKYFSKVDITLLLSRLFCGNYNISIIVDDSMYYPK